MELVQVAQHADDLDRAAAFYSDLLGCSPSGRFDPGAPRERYFEGLFERATMDPKPSPDEMAEFFRVHDT